MENLFSPQDGECSAVLFANGPLSALLGRTQIQGQDSGRQMDHVGELGVQGAGTDPAAAVIEHYRCPPQFASFRVDGELSNDRGFFRFASAVGYGRTASIPRASDPGERLFQAKPVPDLSTHQVRLPFDPTEVIENLRCERYLVSKRSERLFRSLYYSLRPLL